MKYSIAAAAAALSLACAGSALAGEVTAKLVTPVSTPTKVIAGGAMFVCQADTCVAASPTSRTITPRACRELSEEVGAVSSLGDARKQLASDKLDHCNAGVAAPDTQVANR